ncbi:hypothetical protein GCM10017771_35640 [Streptomyces capitiformicae]|uniref:Uncharacterized protein n=1 Tax=Streptomyces capitiformicae TaxID=2014920 RepID=A0A919GPY2_9ACTN|nr:hypothetical protein GCM10017771_35640 [Streptomyces capitiformicae]
MRISGPLGIGLMLLAAACWGCYILLNRTVGALALWQQPPAALACAPASGMLSSAVPFLADLLRHLGDRRRQRLAVTAASPRAPAAPIPPARSGNGSPDGGTHD